MDIAPNLEPYLRPSAPAARIAMGAIVIYQVLLLALISLRPDLDPSWHTISEWAIGPYGWLMKTGFFVSAVAYASLFAMLRRQVRGASGHVGLWLLFVCVVGTVGVGVFTTDPLDGPVRMPSTTGALHIVFGTAALVLLPFAALLINLSLARKSRSWSACRVPLLWTSALPLLGFLGFVVYTACFVVPLGPNARGPGVHIGWPPRVAFFTYMLWLVVLASQALRLARAPRATVKAAARPQSRGARGGGTRPAHAGHPST